MGKSRTQKRWRPVVWTAVLLGAMALPGLVRADVPLRRYAIVIGNGDYQAARGLKNTIADADLVSAFLREQGYVVYDFRDVTKRDFEALLRDSLRDVGQDSEVLLYYAGHGLQIAGGNYLVPVDAKLENAFDVPFQTVSLSAITEIIGARARVQMIILDSCRDNPFEGAVVVTDLEGDEASTGAGFAPLTAPINSLLAFSTSPGTVAYDGAGANSPFTQAFVEVAAAEPEQSVIDVLGEVRRLVWDRTKGKQVSWESSTLVEPLSFGTAAVQGANPEPAPQADTGVGGQVVFNATLSGEVSLGDALTDVLGNSPDLQVTLTTPPAMGQIAILGDDLSRQVIGSKPVPLKDLAHLVYASSVPEQSGAAASDVVLSDGFTLAADGKAVEVAINLAPDPCDREAGDYLDPGGSGLGRYPNEIDADKALAACEAAVASEPTNGRFVYQLGRARLAAGDFDGAKQEFEKARDLGHVRALDALGLLTANAAAVSGGRSEAAAPPEAVALYRQGADQGDPYAMHSLGKQLLRFGASAEERQQGFELLSRAQELGHTFAMNELGGYFIEPGTDHSDPARGLRYYQESADRGDIYGFMNMGVAWRDGLGGLTADPKEAATWLQKASDGGHPVAPGALGMLWASGALGQNGAMDKALEYLDLGLSRGDGWSGANAALLIEGGAVSGLGPEDAATRAARAAALADPEASAAARQVLTALPDKALAEAAQMLVNDLGGNLVVDGDFGSGSKADMERVVAQFGAPSPSDDPVERTIDLARIWWSGQKLRVDLN